MDRQEPLISPFEFSEKSAEKNIEALLQRREFSRAKELIDQRLSLDPNSADAYYLLGVFHYFQNQFQNAVGNFEKCLVIDPKHTDAAICLSVIYNDIGKYDEAKRVFELANQSITKKKSADPFGVDKKFAIKHLELADLYFRYRRYDEAIGQYTTAATLDPHTPDIRVRLAKSYAKNGNVARATQELQKLIQDKPGLLTPRVQLGLMHYSQGNVLEAEEIWEAVLRMDPHHAEVKNYLEMAKYARDQSSRRPRMDS